MEFKKSFLNWKDNHQKPQLNIDKNTLSALDEIIINYLIEECNKEFEKTNYDILENKNIKSEVNNYDLL